MIKQDFIDFNNSFNGGNEDDQYSKTSAIANGASTSVGASNGSGISTVDEISVEEPHDGYVYQVIWFDIDWDSSQSFVKSFLRIAYQKSNLLFKLFDL